MNENVAFDDIANMVTKIVYFTVNGHEEQAEFRNDDCSDDVKGNVHGSSRRRMVCSA